MNVKRTHFPVEIAGVKRRLPLFQDYNDEWGMRSRWLTYSDLWITSA